MAFKYAPYLIANVQQGLELGMQPWLLPGDAFAELQNAYLDHGVIYKRKGYELFGILGNDISAETAGTGTGGQKTFTGITDLHPIKPGVTVTAGDVQFTEFTANALLSVNGSDMLIVDGGDFILITANSLTIDYQTGEYTIVFDEAPALGVPITLAYKAVAGLPCMGIFNYMSSGGTQDLLAFTTRRVNKYNEATNEFEDISGVDLFSGYDYEYFWVSNWLNKAFICNGRDQMRMYDGLSLLPVDIDLDGDDDNDVDSAYLVFPYKDRLVLLRTSEFGNLHPGRARWTNVGFYDKSDEDNYADAPTHEWIVGAAFLKNELCVWFDRSVWLLRYTGDSRLPFRWIRVASNEGLLAKMGMMDFSDEIIGVGSTRIVGTDGDQVYAIDDKIPNLVLSANQDTLIYAYATALDEISQLWISYPSPTADLPDKVVSLNYDEKCFSIMTLPHMVTGYYQENFDLTWDEIDQTWDELEFAWDDRTMIAGYPVTLGGDYEGYVWKLNYGGADDGGAIEMAVKTGRMNPFVKEGKASRLGWVDFLVDRDPTINLTVEYFINHENVAWMTEVVNLDDGSSNTKIWIRSYVGVEADFHQIRLYNNQPNQSVVIHAIMPYFSQAGDLGQQ